MPSHQVNDSGLIQAKLGFNRLKGRTIFPRHLHNARDAALGQNQSIIGAEFSGIGFGT